jgi:hypothetical protein
MGESRASLEPVVSHPHRPHSLMPLNYQLQRCEPGAEGVWSYEAQLPSKQIFNLLSLQVRHGTNHDNATVSVEDFERFTLGGRYWSMRWNSDWVMGLQGHLSLDGDSVLMDWDDVRHIMRVAGLYKFVEDRNETQEQEYHSWMRNIRFQ